jgi:mRNA interferase RelE/StbE
MPKYTIRTHKKVEKFFASHPDIARKAIVIFDQLAEDPVGKMKEFDIKPYKWAPKDHFRLRIGSYRILYLIDQKEIVLYLYDGDSRGQIYK